MNTDLKTILAIAQRTGLAHNNGAGGQYLLCATESQLLAFASTLSASTETARELPAPEEIEAIIACLDDDAAGMLEENEESEVAANMQAASRLIAQLTCPTDEMVLAFTRTHAGLCQHTTRKWNEKREEIWEAWEEGPEGKLLLRGTAEEVHTFMQLACFRKQYAAMLAAAAPSHPAEQPKGGA